MDATGNWPLLIQTLFAVCHPWGTLVGHIALIPIEIHDTGNTAGHIHGPMLSLRLFGEHDEKSKARRRISTQKHSLVLT